MKKTNMMVYGTPYLKMMKSSKGFYYAERKGKDSVAVLVYRKENGKTEVLIRMQPLVFNQGSVDGIEKTGYEHLKQNVLIPCPITGSITGIYDNFIDYAVEEIKEEAGYYVVKEEIESLGMYYVGTQINEVVHCFACNVTGKTCVEPEGDGTYWESISSNQWVNVDSIEREMEINYSGLIIILDRFKKMEYERKDFFL